MSKYFESQNAAVDMMRIEAVLQTSKSELEEGNLRANSASLVLEDRIEMGKK